MKTVKIPFEICKAIRVLLEGDAASKLRISNLSRDWDDLLHGDENSERCTGCGSVTVRRYGRCDLCGANECGACKKSRPCKDCGQALCVDCGRTTRFKRKGLKCSAICSICSNQRVRVVGRKKSVAKVLRSMKREPVTMTFASLAKFLDEVVEHDPLQISVKLEMSKYTKALRLGDFFAQKIIALPSLRTLTLVDVPVVDAFLSSLLVGENSKLENLTFVRCHNIRFSDKARSGRPLCRRSSEGDKKKYDHTMLTLALEEMDVSPIRVLEATKEILGTLVLRRCNFDLDEMAVTEKVKVVLC